MALASVTLSYRENVYTFTEDDQTALRGRLGCDCGKSQLIRDACDPEFPVLKCGSEIEVVAVVEMAMDHGKKPASREKQPLHSRHARSSR